MKQYTYNKFVRILKDNGYTLDRFSGDHSIFTKSQGIHISIPRKLKSVIALRLIKQHKLNTK